MQNRYVNDLYVANSLGISRSSVWRWVREGRLPHPIKFGPNTTRFDLSAIEGFVLEFSEARDERN